MSIPDLASDLKKLRRRMVSLTDRVVTLESRVQTLWGVFIVCAVVLGLDWAGRVAGWLREALVWGVCGLGVLFVLKHFVDGWVGRSQWPEPHGRYYTRWLALGPKSGDYFQWLAEQKGNREPWRGWAERHRAFEAEWEDTNEDEE